MDRRWTLALCRVLPQHLVSRLWGAVARLKRPAFAVRALKRRFVAATGIDLAEAEPIDTYPTLEDLFVRRLRPGARPICEDADALVSPVDGVVGACGTSAEGTLVQAKGRTYSLAQLLADRDDAAAFSGGSFATLYLAPHHYHRIHAPLSGQVHEAMVVPGRLLPVFREAVEAVDGLFAANERLITYLDTPDAGRVAVVKVGATLVGRISVAYDPTLRSNRWRGRLRRARYKPPCALRRGAELGAFELGSTVVLLTQAGRVGLDGLNEGREVRVGERIGTLQGAVRRTAGEVKRPRRAPDGRAS